MIQFFQFYSDPNNWVSLGKQLWTPIGLIAFSLGMMLSAFIMLVFGK